MTRHRCLRRQLRGCVPQNRGRRIGPDGRKPHDAGIVRAAERKVIAMRYQQRPAGARQRLAQRFIGWVWHTDHDDRTPNVVNATIVAAAVIVMIIGATSVRLILGLVIAFVSALFLAGVMASPIRRSSEQGRVNDAVPLYRSILRNSGGRS